MPRLRLLPGLLTLSALLLAALAAQASPSPALETAAPSARVTVAGESQGAVPPLLAAHPAGQPAAGDANLHADASSDRNGLADADSHCYLKRPALSPPATCSALACAPDMPDAAG
jgi:hypothetical protein